MSHVLVIANETVASQHLPDAVQRAGDVDLVTVLAPVNAPSGGYVVYEDTRRAAAGRRLDKTVAMLRGEGIHAHGLVVEADPVTAVRDAVRQLEPPVDEIIVATHPVQKSGWLRKNVVDRITECANGIPVEHVVVDVRTEGEGEANVLVLANETVIDTPLLEKIKQRAQESRASFLLIAPQSDPSEGSHPEAESRLKRALAELRGHGIDAHGQVAHPDPFAAALEAIEEERVDEIIVSTFGPERSGWLRRDLVERLRKETGLPVEHVVVEPAEVGAAPA